MSNFGHNFNFDGDERPAPSLFDLKGRKPACYNSIKTDPRLYAGMPTEEKAAPGVDNPHPDKMAAKAAPLTTPVPGTG